jgi:hypothetical protein
MVDLEFIMLVPLIGVERFGCLQLEINTEFHNRTSLLQANVSTRAQGHLGADLRYLYVQPGRLSTTQGVQGGCGHEDKGCAHDWTLARHSAAWAGASPIGRLMLFVLGKDIRFPLAKFTRRLSRLHEDIGLSSFARGDTVFKDERANPCQAHPVSKRQPEFPFQIFGECHNATPGTRAGSRIARMSLGFLPRWGICSHGDWQAFSRRSARRQRPSMRW